MPTAWLQHRSALVLFLYFPWFPYSPPSLPETQPPVVAAEAGVAGEPQPAAAEEPLVLPGVVIGEIPKGSALEKAGLQVGDVILSWERLPNPPANPEGRSGKIDSPFDWMWLEIEQAPRGVVNLTGQRENKEMVFAVGMGVWGAKALLNLDGSTQSIYRQLINSPSGTTKASVENSIHSLCEALSKSGKPGSCASLLLRLADILSPAQAVETMTEGLAREEGSCNLPCRPSLTAETIGQLREKLGAFADAEENYKTALAEAKKEDPDGLHVGLLKARLARVHWLKGDLDDAELYAREALEIRNREVPQSLLVSVCILMLATIETVRGNLEQAQRYYDEVLPIQERLIPRSLSYAITLNNLANLHSARGKLSTALSVHQEALELRRDLAPGSLDVADSLMNIGTIYSQLGELAAAETHLREAAKIQELSIPQSSDYAMTLSNMASLALRIGDLDKAELLELQALKLREQFVPNSIYLASSLINLGIIAEHRGYAEDAEVYDRRALKILAKVAPHSSKRSGTLINLSDLLFDRGEKEEAIRVSKQALEVLEASEPSSLNVASAQMNLGSLLRKSGKFDDARILYTSALRLRQRSAPRSEAVANSLAALGILAGDSGNNGQARTLLRKALTLAHGVSPRSLLEATIWNNLAELSEQERNFSSALQFRTKALAIRSQKAPGTLIEAETALKIGKIHLRQNRRERALQYLRAAIDSYERQVVRLDSSSERRASFVAKHSDFYKTYIWALIEGNQSRDAFQASEAYRGRIFLSLLAERQLRLGEGASRDLEARRERLQSEIGRIVASTELGGEGHENLLRVDQGHLNSLREDLDTVRRELHRLSPNLAQLRFPQPAQVEEIEARLSKDVILLSFMVDKERSGVFVLSSKSGVFFRKIDQGEAELRLNVNRLRGLLAESVGQRPLARERSEQFSRLSSYLYTSLIGVAEDLIPSSSHIVLVPDGPLHYLPWAVLKRPLRDTAESTSEYLIQTRSISFCLSATLCVSGEGELKPPVVSNEVGRFLAFGDPQGHGGTESGTVEMIGDAQVHAAARRGLLDWVPLPYSRREVEGIAALFPPKQVQIFLGVEATEERAKAIGKSVRILHFATHAHLDDRFPLNSALVLTMPEGFPENRDNGLLQVWEIFERVRLDADLVVLSACESGLGEEQGGEGLIGLTLAFQYAGARTVMASLWSVQDQATSELMIRFYKHLRAGKSKDEALRQAQIELIRGPIEVLNEKGEKTLLDASAPYYWAGFQVYGDWQ